MNTADRSRCHNSADPPEAAAFASLELAPEFLRSMFWNWAGEAATMVSGFVLPRLIGQRMSQEELGIWDYGWSIRSYVALASITLASGAGHYVARLRSGDRWPELTRTLGAMLALALAGSVSAALMTLGLAWLTPLLVNTASAALISDARSLVLSMGLASCIATTTLVFSGVIVGSRRFDVLNIIDGLSDVFVVVAVLSSLLVGGGLPMMGFCVLARELMNGTAKYWSAGRIRPEIRVRPHWADRPMFREILGFSAKTAVDALSKALQYQVGALVVSTVIGPTGLALYSRPRALILITTRYVMGFSRVLVPVASSLRDHQTQAALPELLIRSTRFGMFLTLPPALLMLIMGRAILRVWMGADVYADNDVLIILVLGYLPLLAQQATYHLLLGLASHGLAGTSSLIGSIVGAGLSVLFVGVLRWGIEGAALATAIPVFVVNLFVLPYAGCRAAQIPLSRYVRESLPTPLLSVAPLAVVLLVGRVWAPADAHIQLLIAALAGTPTLAVVYWFTVLPIHLRQRLLRAARLTA